jgi:hypothetical protein
LALADTLGTGGVGVLQEQWSHLLGVIRSLLEAWWERPRERVTPPVLVNGNDLMKALDISPGPQIGKMLEAIREAQAVGQVNTQEEAFEVAKKLLSD